jgi:CrcB protein
LEKYLWISIGAILGANLRYWLGGWIISRLGSGFPYGTLLINVTGSFILGVIMAMSSNHYVLDPRLRIFLTIGLLGSYTTFSTFTYESVALLQQGQWWLGIANLFGSSLIGALFALFGLWVGRSI